MILSCVYSDKSVIGCKGTAFFSNTQVYPHICETKKYPASIGTLSRVSRGSLAGLPRVVANAFLPQKFTIINMSTIVANTITIPKRIFLGEYIKALLHCCPDKI